MTVSELINALKDCAPNAQVHDDTGEIEDVYSDGEKVILA
jgi:hypothetical protein